MPNYHRVWVPGSTCFFTLVLQDRSRTLLIDHVDSLRRAFREAISQRPCEVIAAVVLPDHLHCVWRLPDDDPDNAIRWRHIKALFSRSLPPDDVSVSPSRYRKRERGVWQRRFWERLLRDDRDLAAHVDYIHMNPVKHGLVARPIDWPHSSIHRYIRRGELAADWACAPVALDCGGEQSAASAS